LTKTKAREIHTALMRRGLKDFSAREVAELTRFTAKQATWIMKDCPELFKRKKSSSRDRFRWIYSMAVIMK
jgi:hypothetical protein